MKRASKSPRKSIRKNILVPLLGMSMAVSSYSTALAEPEVQPAAPQIAAAQNGSQSVMKLPFLYYCYYWDGFWYCYYYYDGFFYYCYYC